MESFCFCLRTFPTFTSKSPTERPHARWSDEHSGGQEAIVIDRWGWLWENPSKPSHRGKGLDQPGKPCHQATCSAGCATYRPLAGTPQWTGHNDARCVQKPSSGWNLLSGPGQMSLQRAAQQPGSPRWLCLRQFINASGEKKSLRNCFPQRPPPLSWANKGRGCHSHCVEL